MLANYLYCHTFSQLLSTIHENQSDNITTAYKEKAIKIFYSHVYVIQKFVVFYRAHKVIKQNDLPPVLK